MKDVTEVFGKMGISRDDYHAMETEEQHHHSHSLMTDKDAFPNTTLVEMKSTRVEDDDEDEDEDDPWVAPRHLFRTIRPPPSVSTSYVFLSSESFQEQTRNENTPHETQPPQHATNNSNDDESSSSLNNDWLKSSGTEPWASAPPSYIYDSLRSSRVASPMIERIREQVRSMTLGTELLHHTCSSSNSGSQLLDLTKDTLQTHCLLGKGSFSLVTAVTIQQGKSPQQPQQARPRYYACKTIKEDLAILGGKPFEIAASELAYEAHILSCLDHPHIIKIRGLDASGVLGFERDGMGFFLLMDVLQETLDRRIDRWRRTNIMDRNGSTSGGQSIDSILLRQTVEKLDICLQLADALEYIHKNNIVYRDLKPANIGFAPLKDGSTMLKLFDFGLCRELTPVNSAVLKGGIGTMRYMAPEVCLGLSYGSQCDIFSYAIICWELWTHRVPFETVRTAQQYREFVCKRGYRPYPDESKERTPVHDHDINSSISNYHSPMVQQHLSSPADPLWAHDPSEIPREVFVLLSKAWKHHPKSRIRWPKIANVLSLVKTLIGLQLEEQEIAESAIIDENFDTDDENNFQNDDDYDIDELMVPDFVINNETLYPPVTP